MAKQKKGAEGKNHGKKSIHTTIICGIRRENDSFCTGSK
jgi:hypothetical protein